MASTYSALKIELIGTGEQSGTWGTTTNTNLGDAALGEAITGSATVDFATDADVTITLTDVNTTQSARNLRLNITESSTGVGSVRNLILGSGCQIEKFYLINNTGTGAKTVKNTSGTGIAVPAGKATLVYNNGTNVVDAATYFTSLTLGSALPVASGGTGATSNAATAFALKGANSDITSLTGLTTALTVAQGGTGAATLTGVLKGAGTAAFSAATAGTDYVAPGTATTFSAIQTFNSGNLKLAGSSSGTSVINAQAVAGTTTMTLPATTSTLGYLNLPAVGTKTGSYTLATTDVGKYVQLGAAGAITIPDATFAEGDAVSIFNNTSGAITITCTITTAYIAGTDTDKATVSLATRGVCTILFISGTTCVITGNVS